MRVVKGYDWAAQASGDPMSSGHAHMIPLPPVGDGSQTSRLADEPAMAIHLGRLPPGAPLREVEIAETSDVGRTIVRAVTRQLRRRLGRMEDSFPVVHKDAMLRPVS
jgi:hypothetical protein